jgi:hypothetical protein
MAEQANQRPLGVVGAKLVTIAARLIHFFWVSACCTIKPVMLTATVALSVRRCNGQRFKFSPIFGFKLWWCYGRGNSTAASAGTPIAASRSSKREHWPTTSSHTRARSGISAIGRWRDPLNDASNSAISHAPPTVALEHCAIPCQQLHLSIYAMPCQQLHVDGILCPVNSCTWTVCCALSLPLDNAVWGWRSPGKAARQPRSLPLAGVDRTTADQLSSGNQSGLYPNLSNLHRPECTKKYSQRGQLTIHLRTHTGETPYRCSERNCNKRFASSSQLSKHVQSHAEVYVCVFVHLLVCALVC